MVTFEALLDRSLDWGLQEADRYFSGKGLVRQTLRDLATRLNELDVEFAVIGAVAMFYHGYRRFTQDIDILVTAEGFASIGKELLGNGYVRPTGWRRGFRDIETGVAIHVFVSGSACGAESGYVVPHPTRSSRIDGINVLELASLLEMKFALGSAPGELRHLGDAQELIRYSGATLDFAANLAPSFRDRFIEYWHDVQIAKMQEKVNAEHAGGETPRLAHLNSEP
jgi:hypothetical protein